MLSSQNDTIANLLQYSRFFEARELSTRVCAEGRANAETWCMLAIASGHLGFYEESQDAAAKAIKFAPRYIYAYLIRGIALMNLSRPLEAQQCFRKILKLQPGHGEAEKNLGRSWHNMKNLNKAIFHYKRALKSIPRDSELVYYLCDAYERNHNTENCRELLKVGLAEFPDHAGIGLVEARLDKADGDLEAACAKLKKLLLIENLGSELLAMIWNELGHVQDRLGDYDEAFKAFSRGQVENERNAGGGIDRDYYYRRIRNNQKVITRASAGKWDYTEQGMTAAPVFLVGFPRSGTTLMERALSSHSKIITSDEQDIVNTLIQQLPELTGKTVAYPDVLDLLSRKDIKKLRKQYWSAVQKVNGEPVGKRVFLDKLPLNLVDTGFIHRIFPESKFIFALRDPRDCCLSCFMQLFGNNEAMIHFSNMESAARFYAAVMDLWQHYTDVLDIKVYEYKYEKLVEDLESVIRPLIGFIGLEWEDGVKYYHARQNIRFSSTPSYQDITKPIYTRAKGRWRNYACHIQPALDILEPYVKRFMYER